MVNRKVNLIIYTQFICKIYFILIMLKISLLGTPQIHTNGLSLSTVITGRELALLAFLAVTGKSHDRGTLVDLLWNDVSEQQALKNLRNVLYSLRKSIGSYLDITRQKLALMADNSYWLDVTIFHNYWLAPQSSDRQEMLPEILKLYRGNFLEGFTIQDAPVFEMWLLEQQRTLQDHALQGLHLLTQQYMADSNTEAALLTTRRILHMAPWDENAHRQLMLLYAYSGQRSAALAQYNLCQQALATEYGVAPMPETTALYMQIKAGQVVQPAGQVTNPTHARTVFTVLPTVTSPSSTPPLLPSAPQVNWDAVPTAVHLDGRETELYQLQHWLLKEQCRLVAVFGVSGQGKTALVAELVHRLVEKSEGTATVGGQLAPFTRMVWSSASGGATVAQILQTWITQLTAAPSPAAPLFTQPAPPIDLLLAPLLHLLRKERCLLILDQAECLLRSTPHQAGEEEALAMLFRWMTEGEHQSALIFSSSLQPQSLVQMARHSSLLRLLRLTGLSTTAGVELLNRYGLAHYNLDLAQLVTRYAGNPLALTLLSGIAHHFPAHTLDLILQREPLLFAELHKVLKQQFDQLPPLAQKMSVWLAIEQAPISFELLWEYFLKSHRTSAVMAAYTSLQQALFVEQAEDLHMIRLPALFELYVIHHVVDQLVEELNTQDQFFAPIYLNSYLLLNPQRTEQVQALQNQVILQPILKTLAATWGVAGLIRRFHDLISVLNTYPLPAGRYAQPNLQALLTLLEPQFSVSGDYLVPQKIGQPTLDRRFIDEVSKIA